MSEQGLRVPSRSPACAVGAQVSARLVSLRGPRGREGSEQERCLIRLRFAFLHARRNDFKALETGNVKLCLPDTSRKVENGQIKGTWCCGRAEVPAESLRRVPPPLPGQRPRVSHLGITVELKDFLFNLTLLSRFFLFPDGNVLVYHVHAPAAVLVTV